MKLLFSGDLHIGRRSSRVPEDCRLPTSAAQVWKRIVDVAIEKQVDLVLLSGDVVDRDNKFYEAIGPLERGLERLMRAGIRTLAVAGNHDYDVLVRLAGSMGDAGFQLLGANGHWQRKTIQNGDGRPVLHIDGWSFPDEHVRTSPLDSCPPPPEDGLPALMMIHGELGNPASTYAPLDRERMQSRPVTGWLIGHIHAPRYINDPNRPFILNPGSPQALDPGETGPHGAWLVELQTGRAAPDCTPISLSTVWYENLTVELNRPADRAAADDAVRAAVVAARRKVERAADGRERHLCIRLTLAGLADPALAEDLNDLARELRDPEADLGSATCSVSLDKVTVAVRPYANLDALARERHAAADLARLLLALDRGGSALSEYDELIDAAVRRLRQVHRHRDFEPVSDEAEPGREQALHILRQQADRLLVELLTHREERP